VQKELGGPPAAGSSTGEAARSPTPSVFLSLTLSETSPHVQRLAEPEDWCVPELVASLPPTEFPAFFAGFSWSCESST